jgi:hypothetical protein
MKHEKEVLEKNENYPTEKGGRCHWETKNSWKKINHWRQR